MGKRMLQLLSLTALLSLGQGLAQGSLFSLRGFGGLGVGFGTVNAELEWQDPLVRVYPRGSVAYVAGVGGTAGGNLAAFAVHGGAAIYLGDSRDGWFSAARVGGGVVADTTTRVGTFFGTATLSGGYRLVQGPFELGLEGGLYLASVDLDSTRSAVLLSPVVLLSAGIRF
ncbi:MAG: hypothetical protein SFU83_07230 [Meiothermus sp.]|nr:hypothetical protein [Meiothermus sp.]